MKYIIMCGGNYKKWQKPKQLAEVDGEPIVARTIRLLREHGVTDIAISSNNPVFEQFDVPVLHHKNDWVVRGNEDVDGYWVDCFYPTDEPVCYVFGDVLFSPQAIRTIVDTPVRRIMLFGSKRPFAPEYPKPYREPFAYKVADQEVFREAIEEVKRLHAQGAFNRHPIAWNLWAVICGTDLNHVNRRYHAINDYTCDFDSPDDYDKYNSSLLE